VQRVRLARERVVPFLTQRAGRISLPSKFFSTEGRRRPVGDLGLHAALIPAYIKDTTSSRTGGFLSWTGAEGGRRSQGREAPPAHLHRRCRRRRAHPARCDERRQARSSIFVQAARRSQGIACRRRARRPSSDQSRRSELPERRAHPLCIHHRQQGNHVRLHLRLPSVTSRKLTKINHALKLCFVVELEILLKP